MIKKCILFFAVFAMALVHGTYEELKMQVGPATFHVKLANTAEKGIKGLSGYVSMGKNSGMLFLFKKHYLPRIWMKGMKFPLDIVWIRNRQVQEITENVPVLNQSHKEKPPLYSPKQYVDMILEINAGEAAKQRIRVGDQVRFLK